MAREDGNMAKRGRRPRVVTEALARQHDAVSAAVPGSGAAAAAEGAGAAPVGRLFPRGITRLGQPGVESAERLQEAAASILAVTRRLDEVVSEARARGLSWDSVGFCVGMTGEAARQRWGGVA